MYEKLGISTIFLQAVKRFVLLCHPEWCEEISRSAQDGLFKYLWSFSATTAS
jgi:hypothetical protein